MEARDRERKICLATATPPQDVHGLIFISCMDHDNIFISCHGS